MKGKCCEIRDAVLQDDKLWYFYRDFRCLFSMDIETGETSSYEIPIVKKNIHKDAFMSMALMGHTIYLIPYLDNVIMRFDIDSEQFEKLELDERVICENDELFWGVGKWEQYLFLMGTKAPVILRVNTDDNRIDYIMDWYQQVENLIFNSEYVYFRRQCVVEKGKLFVPFSIANAILEMDCISMETVVHRLGEEKQGYSGICLEENSLWLSPVGNGDVVKWNMLTKRIDIISVSELQTTTDSFWYWGIVVSGDKKLLFPDREKKQVCIKDKNVEEMYGNFEFLKHDGIHAFFSESDRDIISIMELATGKRVDLKLGSVNMDITGTMEENNNFIVENTTVGLRNYIRYVSKN